jgi:FkbM family methyltransferase
MHQLIDRYADSSKIAIDVGASLGFHAIYMAGKFAQVVAFEPQEVIAGLLERSLLLNGIKNVSVYNMALSDHEGIVRIPDIDYESTISSGSISIAYKEGVDANTNTGWDRESYLSIKSDALDNMIDSDQEVGFVKIDVEGYEYKVILGAERMLRRNLCPLAIEIIDLPIGNFKRIDSFLENIGYKHREPMGFSEWDYLYTV